MCAAVVITANSLWKKAAQAKAKAKANSAAKCKTTMPKIRYVTQSKQKATTIRNTTTILITTTTATTRIATATTNYSSNLATKAFCQAVKRTLRQRRELAN